MATLNFPYKYGFHKPENYVFKSKKGLDTSVVRDISWHKNEPEWMRDFRLRSLGFFEKKPLPLWGGDLTKINFNDIYYYIKPTQGKVSSWSDLPPEIKDTYDKIGIPEAEKKFLAGVSAQYECLSGDSFVFGDLGATQIKNLRVGDFIYALNEKTKKFERQKVLGILRKGNRPVSMISVAGRSIRCTLNHPFYVLRYTKEKGKRRGNFYCSWEYAKNLSKGDYIAISKHIPTNGHPYKLPAVSLKKTYKGKNQFTSFSVKADWLFTRNQKNLRLPSETSNALLWLIGLYIGDGYISRSSKNGAEVLNFAIPSQEIVLRKRLIQVVKAVFGATLHNQNDPNRIRLFSRPIIDLFTALGLRGTAKTKKLPDWIFGLPQSQKLAFIAGHIDSDGYVRHGKKNFDVWITSVNKNLMEKVSVLGVSCGLHITGVHNFRYTIYSKNTIAAGYRLQITGDISPLRPFSYKVSKNFHPRAYYHTFGSHHKSPIDKWMSKDFGFAPIRSIIPSGNEEVYDIEVNGHHNFVANGIIVHNSEVVYKSINQMLSKKGVIFLDMDSGLREHPDIVRKYFGTVIPPMDNKFAALNSSVWSGGSFVYVPKGVHVELPLQAYFRINAANMGQFERTLIIAEEGSYVHYVEGCTAPVYSTDSLHAAVVEIIVKKGARVRYTTIQNWSNNVYNLVTKRSRVEEEGTMEWVDGNLGSKLTMKYPSIYLMGPKARGEVLSIAYAGPGQHQDAGGKAIHVAPETSSQIISKSISRGGGRTSYRGLVQVNPGATNVKSKVVCDALILDEASRSDTYPTMKIDGKDVTIEHEATVSKIGDEQLFYLESRGISKNDAQSMIVNGFIEPIVKELPLEYAVEMNRLIALQMEGSVG